uniref:NB-ARC domain-containing protein n=1 Tax=Oryza barthii TaxID=65489 RepID=A0A0D3HC92_9ORYZ
MTTTRIRSVAAACCNYNYEDIYNMKALTDQDAKRLFFNRIFGSGASQPNNLKEQWEYIRNSLGTSHGENPTLDGMRKILNLSYTNLPHCIKACFLYVGIYPEDFTIKKDDLIKLWVAEGFVCTAHNDYDAYCVARGYFNELINRSMIQPILLDHNDDVLTCRVHDMILDLIISKSTDENLFTIVNDSKFMRSYGFIPNVLDFRSLQVLILENSDQQDLTGICTLTQLRGSSFVGYKDVLFQSLARLADCNLKDLHINHHLSTMCCDSLNGLFKSAHHLQRLFLSDWQFSRVPSWIGELNVLHSLELSLGKLLKDDILILAEMPSLAHLYLHVRSAAKERIVISGTTFIVLKHFKLICKRIPLTFEAGAMSKLQILELEFNARGMERQMELPFGIGHLSSLKQIHASISGFRATLSDRTAVEFVFNNVMCIHPNHPCVDIKYEPYKFIDWDDEDEYM